MGATRANDFPRRADDSGRAACDHARSRADPDDAERDTGIYGSEGWGFESLRARQVTGPSGTGRALLANGFANSGHQLAPTARAKMAAASASCSLIRWAWTRSVIDGSACPGRRDDVHGHARAQQGRRVDVPQIVQPRDRYRPACFQLGPLRVVSADQHEYEPRHSVGIDGLTQGCGEYVAVGLAAPLRFGG
jgi:hypothetical protein